MFSTHVQWEVRYFCRPFVISKTDKMLGGFVFRIPVILLVNSKGLSLPEVTVLV